MKKGFEKFSWSTLIFAIYLSIITGIVFWPFPFVERVQHCVPNEICTAIGYFNRNYANLFVNFLFRLAPFYIGLSFVNTLRNKVLIVTFVTVFMAVWSFADELYWGFIEPAMEIQTSKKIPTAVEAN